MFTMKEHWLPTVESRDIIDKYGNELIPKQLKPDHFRDYLDAHRARLGFDLDYAEKFFATGQKILEVGGLPFFLTIPLMKKYDVTTVDKITAEYSSEIVESYGVKSLNCDLDCEPIPADDNSFDGIIMNEVFEHLRGNLIFTMKEILRVLRPDGLLLMSTPNLRSAIGIRNLVFRGQAYTTMGGIYENYSYLYKIGMMGHVREYTPTEVTEFLQEIGFRIEGIIYRGCYAGSMFLNLSQYFTRIWPQFKPLFSVVARKPA